MPFFMAFSRAQDFTEPRNTGLSFPKNQDLHQINKAIFIWKAGAVPQKALVLPFVAIFLPFTFKKKRTYIGKKDLHAGQV